MYEFFIFAAEHPLAASTSVIVAGLGVMLVSVFPYSLLDKGGARVLRYSGLSVMVIGIVALLTVVIFPAETIIN